MTVCPVTFNPRDRCKQKVVARNLTRAEALAWTNDRNTSSKTAWKTAEIKTTRRCGPWFDGFTAQRRGGAR